MDGHGVFNYSSTVFLPKTKYSSINGTLNCVSGLECYGSGLLNNKECERSYRGHNEVPTPNPPETHILSGTFGTPPSGPPGGLTRGDSLPATALILIHIHIHNPYTYTYNVTPYKIINTILLYTY